LETIEKEVVPNFSKLENTSLFRASVAVRIPTSEVIPTAIIKTVSKDLSLLLLTDFNATFRFSLTRGETTIFILTPYPPQFIR
jgi:hypothetical protein